MTAAAAVSGVSAASRVARADGYPTLLPVTSAKEPQTSPYWYDDIHQSRLWDERLSKVTAHTVVQPMQLPTSNGEACTVPPKPSGHLRFLSISDTHNFHDRLPLPPPADLGVDVLLHGGDFSDIGKVKDVEAFTNWIRAVDIKYKVVIAGNHDVSFDEGSYANGLGKRFDHSTLLDPRQLKANLVAGYEHAVATPDNPFPAFAADGGVAYLEDSGVSIHGVRIWGSPWQPEFYESGFNLPRGEPLREKWDLIPNETQVLITHGPPIGHGDLCLPGNIRAGCVDLLLQIQTRIKPLYHISGHIHEGYGQTTDGVTHYINASSCNMLSDNSNLNPPIIFDVPVEKTRSNSTSSPSPRP